MKQRYFYRDGEWTQLPPPKEIKVFTMMDGKLAKWEVLAQNVREAREAVWSSLGLRRGDRRAVLALVK